MVVIFQNFMTKLDDSSNAFKALKHDWIIVKRFVSNFIFRSIVSSSKLYFNDESEASDHKHCYSH